MNSTYFLKLSLTLVMYFIPFSEEAIMDITPIPTVWIRGFDLTMTYSKNSILCSELRTSASTRLSIHLRLWFSSIDSPFACCVTHCNYPQLDEVLQHLSIVVSFEVVFFECFGNLEHLLQFQGCTEGLFLFWDDQSVVFRQGGSDSLQQGFVSLLLCDLS